SQSGDILETQLVLGEGKTDGRDPPSAPGRKHIPPPQHHLHLVPVFSPPVAVVMASARGR
ncbi:hypothetical protein KUCAC02_032129, partial [Chaenocephalus aceratus]